MSDSARLGGGYASASPDPRPTAQALLASVSSGDASARLVVLAGPPGVGKTELAKTTALLLDLPLIRLQCYEGLDEAKALYEWKYGKQLLYTQVLKEKLGDLLQGARGLAESVERLHQFGDIFYSEDFLEPRPLVARGVFQFTGRLAHGKSSGCAGRRRRNVGTTPPILTANR